MNFGKLIRGGSSFTATPSNWGAYQHWLATEAKCEGCGKKRSDVKRNEKGEALEIWVTEVMCGDCWNKGHEERKAMKQRYGKPDANHGAVKGWYEQLGCTVADTKDAGFGVPDLFVGCVGITDPVEVKTEDGGLEPSQETFITKWRGSATRIVRTQQDVADHVQDMRRRARRAA